MVAIAANHVIGHGLGLAGLENAPFGPGHSKLLSLPFLVVAVNGFVLISGYYGIRFRSRNVAFLIGQGFAYSLAVAVAARWVPLGSPVVSPWQYWFLTGYLGLFLLAPFLNELLATLSNRRLGQLLAVSSVLVCGLAFHSLDAVHGINRGFSVPQMVFVYTWGHAIRRFGWTLPRTTAISVYLALSLATGAILLVLYRTGHALFASRFLENNSPLLVAASIALFLFFAAKRFESLGTPTMVSRHVFGVYLLHDNPAVREHVVKRIAPWLVQQDSWWQPLQCGAVAVAIFAACLPASIAIDSALSWILDRRPAADALRRLDRALT